MAPSTIYPFNRPADPHTPVRAPATNQSSRTAMVAESADGSPALPTAGDPRQAALQMLLDKAALYGDQGSSTSTIQNILGGVDMGRAGRMAGIYETRRQQLQDSGSTYLDALSAALTKKRQMAGARRRSSSSTSSSTLPAFQWTPFNWQQFMALTPPTGPSSSVPRRGGSNRGSVDY